MIGKKKETEVLHVSRKGRPNKFQADTLELSISRLSGFNPYLSCQGGKRPNIEAGHDLCLLLDVRKDRCRSYYAGQSGAFSRRIAYR
jgi:hypothetical protein